MNTENKNIRPCVRVCVCGFASAICLLIFRFETIFFLLLFQNRWLIVPKLICVMWMNMNFFLWFFFFYFFFRKRAKHVKTENKRCTVIAAFIGIGSFVQLLRVCTSVIEFNQQWIRYRSRKFPISHLFFFFFSNRKHPKRFFFLFCKVCCLYEYQSFILGNWTKAKEKRVKIKMYSVVYFNMCQFLNGSHTISIRYIVFDCRFIAHHISQQAHK